MKGKKEGNKKNIIRFTKVSGMAATAAMLTIVILANSNQSISYAMEKMPIIGAITKVVTFKTFSDKTNNHEANIDIPKIETDMDNSYIEEATNEVNISIEDYTNMLIKQYNADVEASEGEGHYGVDTSYEVITNNDDRFTLRIDTVIAVGGSDSFSKFYHINKKTGTVITLKDIFKDNVDYVTAISDNIKKQMVEQMEADEMVTYMINSEIGDEWDFKEIKADQNFYFNENNELVIVFDKYEVAAGYMGIVEFVIPNEVIGSILK